MNRWFKDVDRKFIYSIMGGSLVGLLIGVVVVYYLYGIDEKSLDIAKIVSSLFIFVSIVLAAMQFRFNRKQIAYANSWNKKQLAITRLHDSRKLLKDIQKKLHGHLEIVDRSADNPFKLYEIHDSFGVRLSDGRFVYHGEQTQEDMRYLPERQPNPDEFRAVEFKDGVNGREIKDYVLDFIGEYEYICSAVNSDVFDDDVVKTLYRKNTIRIFKIFEPYIRHLQETHKYGKTVYSEFEKVAKRYADD